MDKPLTCPVCHAHAKVVPNMETASFTVICQGCGKRGTRWATIASARKSWVAMCEKGTAK